MKWGSERYAIQGITIFLATSAGSMWGAACAFLITNDWFNAAWFGIPALGLGTMAAYLLQPRHSPLVA